MWMNSPVRGTSKNQEKHQKTQFGKFGNKTGFTEGKRLEDIDPCPYIL
jgi:hypothetical protein